jgi:hypothetical protein
MTILALLAKYLTIPTSLQVREKQTTIDVGFPSIEDKALVRGRLPGWCNPGGVAFFNIAGRDFRKVYEVGQWQGASSLS